MTTITQPATGLDLSVPRAQTGADAGPLRVLYIYGTGHNGSTILSFVLDAHPQIVCLGEAKPNVEIQRKDPAAFPCSCGAAVSQCAFWRRMFEAVERQGFAISADNWSNDYRYRNKLLHRIFESRYALRCDALASRVPGHRARNRRIDGVNRAFVRSAVELTGKPVFADASKRPSRLTRLLQIDGLDVRVLHLVRDVRAFACSHKRRRLAPSEAALWWQRTQEFAGRFERELPRDRFLRVRYEDFAVNPQAILDQISGFVGLPAAPVPEVFDATKHHILGNRIRLQGTLKVSVDEKWRQELTEQDLAQTLAIAGEMNASFGYV